MTCFSARTPPHLCGISTSKAQEVTGSRIAGVRQLARIYATMGKRREAMEAAKAIEKDGTLGGREHGLAVIYSALGDRDRAIAQLETGVRERSLLPFIFVEPQLDGIRFDPRFEQLRRRAGLAP